MIISRIYIIAAMTAIVISATAMTTISPVAAQQPSVYIIKNGSNSYTLSGGSSSVSSFDTTYRIAGERSAIKSAENLIVTTVTDDFKESPTIGYIATGSMTAAGVGGGATLPNPFASPEQITERITTELTRVIGEAENNTSQGQELEINCEFGMTLDDMQCHYVPLLQSGQ